jgi:hypothetical protein
MGNQLTANQTVALYSEAVELAKRTVGFHPVLSIFDPSPAVKDWVRDNPEKAAAMAAECYRLLGRYFNGSGPR